jgi:hypothetical protein
MAHDGLPSRGRGEWGVGVEPSPRNIGRDPLCSAARVVGKDHGWREGAEATAVAKAGEGGT